MIANDFQNFIFSTDLFFQFQIVIPNGLLSIASWDNLSKINNSNISCLNLYSPFFHPPLYLHRSKWMVPVACCSSQKPWSPPGFLPLPHSRPYPLHDEVLWVPPQVYLRPSPSSTLCILPYKPLLSLQWNSLRTSVPGWTSPPQSTQNFLLESNLVMSCLNTFIFTPFSCTLETPACYIPKSSFLASSHALHQHVTCHTGLLSLPGTLRVFASTSLCAWKALLSPL